MALKRCRDRNARRRTLEPDPQRPVAGSAATMSMDASAGARHAVDLVVRLGNRWRAAEVCDLP
jgi:hypothetical protein